MSNKQLEELRSEYIEKTQQAQVKAQQANVMNNLHRLSEAQQESIKALAQVDDLSDGNLENLVGIYRAIKSSNKNK